eukprot:8483392-Pyramimonas_sp.AAC.1
MTDQSDAEEGLSTDYRLFDLASDRRLPAAVRMLRATVRMLRATMRMLRATMRMLRATMRMLRATSDRRLPAAVMSRNPGS